MTDPVEEMRQDLAQRVAAKFDVPVEIVLADPALTYLNISAVMELPGLPADGIDRIVRGMQTPDRDRPDLAS